MPKPNCCDFALPEKRRDLIPRSDVDDTLDAIAGIVTTHLGGMAARCTPHLRIRHAIDAVVRQVRTEMAIAANKLADERGEPPLDVSGTDLLRRCGLDGLKTWPSPAELSKWNSNQSQAIMLTSATKDAPGVAG